MNKIIDNTVENTVDIDCTQLTKPHKTNKLGKTFENTETKDSASLDHNSTPQKVNGKNEGIIKKTESHSDKGDTESSLKETAANENTIDTISNDIQSEEVINDEDYGNNGEDHSQQWDLLWQNHCVEVYNSHFETFKQDWLKNLSAALDVVSMLVGIETLWVKLIDQTHRGKK